MPDFNIMGTSFTIPVILTLLPGVVLLSILGSTKSSFKKTDNLFGWSPPPKNSGISSIINLWASTSSLPTNLNLPALPQLHLVGSLNLVSICNIVITLPQEGHSNLAETTCGLTSEACFIMPSIEINKFKCSDLIFLIIIFCVSDKFLNLTLKSVSGKSNCSNDSSADLITSSGFSNNNSLNSGSYSERSLKSITKDVSP